MLRALEIVETSGKVLWRVTAAELVQSGGLLWAEGLPTGRSLELRASLGRHEAGVGRAGSVRLWCRVDGVEQTPENQWWGHSDSCSTLTDLPDTSRSGEDDGDDYCLGSPFEPLHPDGAETMPPPSPQTRGLASTVVAQGLRESEITVGNPEAVRNTTNAPSQPSRPSDFLQPLEDGWSEMLSVSLPVAQHW
eukprot:SAG11_NODE_6616_length_1279_cov_0.842373_2_plen_192_part_00